MEDMRPSDTKHTPEFHSFSLADGEASPLQALDKPTFPDSYLFFPFFYREHFPVGLLQTEAPPELPAGLSKPNGVYVPKASVKNLHKACMEGDVAEIGSLTADDARLLCYPFDFERGDCAIDGRKILHLACEFGTFEAVKALIFAAESHMSGLALTLLLERDSAGKLPIEYAKDRDPRIMRFLAHCMGKHLAKVQPTSWALFLASMGSDDVDVVNAVLASYPKPDLNATYANGNTALHAAAACQNIDVLAELLKLGAPPQAINENGQTPLSLAKSLGQWHSVTKLSTFTGTITRELQQNQEEIESLRRRVAELEETLLQQKAAGESLEAKTAQMADQQGRLQLAHPELKQWRHVGSVGSHQSLRQLLIDGLSQYPIATEVVVNLRESKKAKTAFQPGAPTPIPTGNILFAILPSANSMLIYQRSPSQGISLVDLSAPSKSTVLDSRYVGMNAATVGVSADEKRIAVAHNNVQLWKVVSPSEVQLLGSLPKKTKVNTLVPLTAPDETQSKVALASHPDPSSIEIWDMRTGQLERTLKGHKHPVEFLAELPNQRLVSVSSKGKMNIWDLVQGTLVSSMKIDASISQFVVMPNGTEVATISEDGLKVWDLQAKKSTKISSLKIPFTAAPLTALTVQSNGRIITGNKEGLIEVWERVDKSWKKTTELQSSRSPIETLGSTASDGIVSVSKDRTLRVWEGAQPLTVNIDFRMQLPLIGATFSATAQKVVITTEKPSLAVLTQCAETLKVLYADQPGLVFTVSDQQLAITNIPKPAVSTEIVALCEKFGMRQKAVVVVAAGKPEKKEGKISTPPRNSFAGAYHAGAFPPPPAYVPSSAQPPLYETSYLPPSPSDPALLPPAYPSQLPALPPKPRPTTLFTPTAPPAPSPFGTPS